MARQLPAQRRGEQVRSRNRLQAALAKATASISAVIEALSEQLITIDELRARMSHLCPRAEPAQPDRRPRRPGRR